MSASSGLRRRDDDPPPDALRSDAAPTDDVTWGISASSVIEVSVSQAVLGSSSLPAARPLDRPVRRVLFAALGVVCVGIGAVGVIVPGLPTAIWLIAASYLFMRSHPRLEARLIRNRFFGPYLRYVDNPRSMPRRAKFMACSLMWASVLTSVGVLTWRGTAGPWFAGSLIAAAALGTWVIIRLRPKSQLASH